MSDRTTQTIYQGRIVSLELQDDKWEIVRHSPAVAILALRDGRMLCVRQHRRPLDADTLEVPAGLIEAGESPELAANRELSEEVGLQGDLRLLTRFHSSPGFTDELLYLFLATNLREVPGTPDEDEDITVEWHEPAWVLEGLRTAALQGSATTVTAALFALQELAAGTG